MSNVYQVFELSKANETFLPENDGSLKQKAEQLLRLLYSYNIIILFYTSMVTGFSR